MVRELLYTPANAEWRAEVRRFCQARRGTAMLKSPQRVRALLADKFADAANLALGALVLAQGLGERLSLTAMIVGVTSWIVFLCVALWADWSDQ
jgi:hypothetical protein